MIIGKFQKEEGVFVGNIIGLDVPHRSASARRISRASITR